MRLLILSLIAFACAAHAYFVSAPEGLAKMTERADLVCKARVISIERVTNALFTNFSGFETRSAKLEVISVLKGSAPGAAIEFIHYAPSPSGAFMYKPQHYDLKAGESYLIFALKAERVGAFRAVRDRHTTKEDEGVTRTWDARPLVGRGVVEAHWTELHLLLTNGAQGDVLYAIRQLNEMSSAGAEGAFRTAKDFARDAVLASLLPLTRHTNEEISVAALKCFHRGPASEVYRDGHCGELIALVTNASPPSVRSQALLALAGVTNTHESNAVFRCASDADDLVRATAVRLLMDYPGATSERVIGERASDRSAEVRARACEAIGRARIEKLLPVLAEAMREPGPPVDNISAESESFFRQHHPHIANRNSAVATAAAYALLNFDSTNAKAVLKSNLTNEFFKAGFVSALAGSNAAPWVDDLADVLERRLGPSNWAGGRNPYWECWRLLHGYLESLPPSAFANTAQDRYLRALENAGETGSSEPTRIYELYRTKRLYDRAANFRREYEQKARYDIAYYFNQVDSRTPR